MSLWLFMSVKPSTDDRYSSADETADKIDRKKSAENIGRFFKTDVRLSSADKMDDDDDGFIFIAFQKKTKKT